MSIAIANARWVLFSQGVRVLCQLAGMAFLARLMPPEAYGLMAMAGVVTNFAYLLRDMGTGAAIIQSPQVSPLLASTVHWTNVVLGLAVGVVVAVAAWPMAAAFHEPELAGVLCLLAFIFPLSALGVVRQALLERDSRFARVAKVEMAATVVGLATALVLAHHGFGVMALAAQALLAAGLTSAGFAACTDFRPMLRWSGEAFRAVAGFSGRLSLFNIVLYLSRNADSAIIGRLLGAAPLGVYSLAYRVMLFPVQNLTHVAARALFPLMSRSSREERAERYLRTVAFIAFITAPLMAGLFVLREPFVAVVFGAHWQEAAGVLAWLAPVGFIQSIVSTTGTVFMAAGRSGLLLAMGCLATVLQVLAFAVGTRWGVEGVAACYLVANVINAFPALVCGAHLLGLPPLRLLREIGRPLAAALAMAAAVVPLSAWVAGQVSDTLAVLLLSILGGVAAYAAAGLLMRSQVRQLRLFLGFR